MLAILLQLLLAGEINAAGNTLADSELRYRGTLASAPDNGQATGDPQKRFELYCVVRKSGESQHELFYSLDEYGGGGWPWPTRFGSVGVPNQNARSPIRLLFDHDGTSYPVPVPFPIYAFADKLAAEAQWEAPRAAESANQADAAAWKYRVAGKKKIGGRDCWAVEVQNSFGPQEKLWIDAELGIVVRAEKRVVVGRGDVHQLKLELESIMPLQSLPAPKREKLIAAVDTLMKLKTSLKRGEDVTSPELSSAELALATAAAPMLEPATEGTPLSHLGEAIARDAKAQTRRMGDVENLAKRLVGKPAPALQLKTIDGQPIDKADLAGQVVLLHFWSYQGEPFPTEPYGQVGYLDFLHNRRKKLGVRVIGVAVNRNTKDATKLSSHVRSVRKLQSFMNLGYTLATDDGTLLDKFGDPEQAGVKLPLWVMIGADGNVALHKSGAYEIRSDEGLRELDKALMTEVQKGKAKKATQ